MPIPDLHTWQKEVAEAILQLRQLLDDNGIAPNFDIDVILAPIEMDEARAKAMGRKGADTEP